MAQPTSIRRSYPRSERLLTAHDGTKIYATERGAGEVAVVVVHGFSGGHRHGSHARLLSWFEQHFRVIAIDQRGHGKSGGFCTLSHLEVQDVDAAVGWARELGAQHVVTVGFSMGSSSVLRHAALSQIADYPLHDQRLTVQHVPDAVVSIGGVSHWWYRGTFKTQVLHLLWGTALGRAIIQKRLRVRIGDDTWPAENAPDRAVIQPLDPADSMAALAPVPVLVIQGSNDDYFPPHHGQRLISAAVQAGHPRATLWLEQDMGHAEAATTVQLVDRMSGWIRSAVGMGQ